MKVSINRIKGALLVILGAIWIVFVYNFDTLMGKPTAFGIKAIFCFIAGMIAIVNGIRIYRRRE